MNINCDYCNIVFDRSIARINVSKKRGHKSFCSRLCQNKHRRDLGIFDRVFWRCRSNSKSRDKDFNITPEYIKILWNNQKGICPYSGVKLDWHSKSNNLYPSLDRINTSLGYIIGNVQWVSKTINYAKHTMSNEEMLEFIKLIRTHKL